MQVNAKGAVVHNERMIDPDRPMVHRHRLLGRLARRHDRAVTSVIAGAGFGKSTLIGQMLGDVPAAPSRSDVLVPLRAPAPDVDAFLAMIAASLDMPVHAAIDVDVLVKTIWARSPEHVAIVIDDVHLLGDEAAAALRELLDRMPLNGHLVLVGRRWPFELPQRATIDGSSELLTETDLAFDDDELRAFAGLRQVASDSSMSSSTTRWPALRELEYAAGRSGVVRYLVEELLGSIDARLLGQLRRVAVHGPLDAELVDFVLAEPGAARTADHASALSLADISNALPMTTWSDGGTALVLHDLVREALIAGLSDGERREALGRFATVLAARGDNASAVRLYGEVGDLESIDRIARSLVDDLFMRDGTAANRSLLSVMREHLGDRLVLDALDGVLTLLDHPERARPILERAVERSRLAGEEVLETLCVLRLAEDAYLTADHDALDRHVRRMRELAAAGAGEAQRLYFVAEVWQLSLAGRHGDVVELVGKILADEPDPTDPRDPAVYEFARFSWVIHRGYSGHLVEALAEAETMLSLPDGLYSNRLAGFGLIKRWELGEQTAQQRADAVVLVDRIEAMGQTALFVEGAATTALFFASAGDVATASSLLERAERDVPRLPASAWPVHTVAQCRAVLQVMSGDEPAAAATLRRSLPERGVAGLPRFVYGATAALVYLLLPETRAVWDGEPCGPDHRVRLQVGRALVALRDRNDPSEAAALPWGTLDRLRVWAYEPHLAELAVAAVGAGVARAGAVFDTLRHDPRRHLEALASTSDGRGSAQAEVILRTLPRRPCDIIRVRALGGMSLRRDGLDVDDDTWTRRQRVRDLFGMLVHFRNVERSVLAEAMWPDKGADAASSNLRYTLSQLLSVLEPERDVAGPTWHIRSVGSQLQLLVDELLVVDVDEFRSAIAAAKLDDANRAPGRALDRYRRAIGLYTGAYLADISDDRLVYLERIRVQGDLVDAVSRSVDLLVAADELDEAEHLAVIGVGAEPLNERVVASLAQVLIARRRVGAAREVIERILGELRAIDLEPEPTTRDLAVRLGVPLAPAP
jgi:DNA-binding SARP family transcriptional activator